MTAKKEPNADDTKTVSEEETRPPQTSEKPNKFLDELEQCERNKKEYLEGWQRAKADYINYKNEEGRRMEDVARFITAGLIQEILPVLDSFDLALGHGLPVDVERGVLLIRSQFEDIFKKRGFEQIKVSPGDNFNPEWHESIGEVGSDLPEGVIAEEVQRGYIFRGKVLRPTRIRLSKPLT